MPPDSEVNRIRARLQRQGERFPWWTYLTKRAAIESGRLWKFKEVKSGRVLRCSRKRWREFRVRHCLLGGGPEKAGPSSRLRADSNGQWTSRRGGTAQPGQRSTTDGTISSRVPVESQVASSTSAEPDDDKYSGGPSPTSSASLSSDRSTSQRGFARQSDNLLRLPRRSSLLRVRCQARLVLAHLRCCRQLVRLWNLHQSRSRVSPLRQAVPRQQSSSETDATVASMIAGLDEIANRMASLDATLVKGNASAPPGAEVSSGSSKWLPPLPSLIEPSSDLRSGSRAELNTNSVREAMDDSAAPSATSAQPTRPEGRSLPVGAESDPILSSPTSRVKQVGLIAQEFNPEILNIQDITAFNQQPYLNDFGTDVHSSMYRAVVPRHLAFSIRTAVPHQLGIKLLLDNQSINAFFNSIALWTSTWTMCSRASAATSPPMINFNPLLMRSINYSKCPSAQSSISNFSSMWAQLFSDLAKCLENADGTIHTIGQL